MLDLILRNVRFPDGRGPLDVGIQGGSTEITGDFTLTEAQDLSALIEGGALPLELELISDRLVGPTLGAEAIDAS